jgi:hypothetical protein
LLPVYEFCRAGYKPSGGRSAGHSLIQLPLRLINAAAFAPYGWLADADGATGLSSAVIRQHKEMACSSGCVVC